MQTNRVVALSTWAAGAAVASGLSALPMIFVAAQPSPELGAVVSLFASIAWLSSVGLLFFSLVLSAPTVAKAFGAVDSFSQRLSLVLMVLNMGWAFKLSGLVEVIMLLLGSIALGVVAGRIVKYFNPQSLKSLDTEN